jgi:hypothetical protein
LVNRVKITIPAAPVAVKQTQPVATLATENYPLKNKAA